MIPSSTQEQQLIDAHLLAETIDILYIETCGSDVHFISQQLFQAALSKYTVTHADSLAMAEQMLAQFQYDIIFLDLELPDSESIDNLTQLRQFDTSTPIIALSKEYEHLLVDDIINCGGQDYLPKSELNSKLMERSIRYAIEHKRIEYKLEVLAHHDPLTQLSNRAIFMDRLKQALLRLKRQKTNNHVVVMLLDLDNFKTINDTMGHDAGDKLLLEVASRLKSCVRETDTVARLGGDEFTILFEQVDQLNTISVVANKIAATLAEPFFINNRTIASSASIGVASSADEKRPEAESVLKNADIAMYTAKNKGGNQIGFFTRELQVSAQIRNNLEKNLRIAIEENQLKLFFQPQINIQTGKLCGAESLMRWEHPQYGIIPPSGFIPSLEETGLILPATEWAIAEAVSIWESWLEAGVVDDDMHVSVNIPPKFINQHNFCQGIDNIISGSGVRKDQIEFELIENTFMDITAKNLERLKELTGSGYRLAIDDFGTGYSSLGYIKAFPIDCVKLDRLFVKDIIDSPKDEAIAEAMINLCQKLDINLVAEGVDSLQKLERLKKLNCEIIQGFYFSEPLPVDEFTSFVDDYKRTG